MKEEKQQPNIVVFGAEGMLGKDLIEMLSYEDNISYRGYSRSECDITDYNDVYSAIGGAYNITNVINCAAYTDVDGCEDNEDTAYAVNAKSLEHMAKICLESEIHLTHISTDYVFQGNRVEPYLEQDKASPLSVYGKSKLSGEGHVRGMGDKGLVIRTSWLYGKHKKNFVDTALDKLELGVGVNAVGDQTGSPTYTMDLANVIIQLAISFKSGIFHASNSGYCTWYEFIKRACHLTDLNEHLIRRVSWKTLNLKAERPAFSVLSMNRLNRTLPEPVRSWEDGLAQYLSEIKRIYE